MKLNTRLYRFIFLAFATYLNSGCTKHEESKHINSPLKKYSGNITLSNTGQVVYKLDSATAPTTHAIEYFELNEKPFFSMLSLNDNTITIFDEESKEIINKIHLNNGSKNSVGKASYLGYHVINKDSIILINEWTNGAFIINFSGEVIFKKYIDRDQVKREGMMAKTVQPITFRNKNIYTVFGATGLRSQDHTKRHCSLVINTVDKSLKHIVNRPNSYNQGNWGSHCMMDYAYVCYNNNKDLSIFSFPVDSNIYIYNAADKLIEKKLAASVNVDVVTPMTRDMLEITDIEKSVEYDYTTSHYYAILYDKYRNCYYRFVLHGNSKADLLNPSIVYDQEFSIIILNENFTKIGETHFPRGVYDYTNFFVSKKGLCILKKPKLYSNENDMIYLILTQKLL